MSFKFSNTFLFIVLAIFFGSLSGILGFIIVGAGNFSIPLIGRVSYINPGLDNNIIIEQPRSVIINHDTQVKNIENRILPTVSNIYLTKKVGEIIASAYNDNEILGRGLVLTSDGWLVSTNKALFNDKGQYLAVGYQSKKYNLSGLIGDSATDLVFIKKNEASNLPVAKIVKSDNLTLGQTVVVAGGRDNLLVTNISKIGYEFKLSKDLILNSDKLVKRIYLSSELDDNYEGAPLVNFKGEVIGIVSDGSVIPSDYFLTMINRFLNSQEISRASLGVSYLDLAQVDGLIDWAEKGAYVTSDPIRGSAGFGFVKKGDLIKKVNDFELNAFKGLAEAINEFRVGDRVDLLINRGNQDLVIPVILK